MGLRRESVCLQRESVCVPASSGPAPVSHDGTPVGQEFSLSLSRWPIMGNSKNHCWSVISVKKSCFHCPLHMKSAASWAALILGFPNSLPVSHSSTIFQLLQVRTTPHGEGRPYLYAWMPGSRT